MDEATAEGIKNGVTFIFQSGSGMLMDTFNLTSGTLSLKRNAP